MWRNIEKYLNEGLEPTYYSNIFSTNIGPTFFLKDWAKKALAEKFSWIGARTHCRDHYSRCRTSLLTASVGGYSCYCDCSRLSDSGQKTHHWFQGDYKNHGKVLPQKSFQHGLSSSPAGYDACPDKKVPKPKIVSKYVTVRTYQKLSRDQNIVLAKSRQKRQSGK